MNAIRALEATCLIGGIIAVALAQTRPEIGWPLVLLCIQGWLVKTVAEL